MSPQIIPVVATIAAAILVYRLIKFITRGSSLPLPPGPRPWPIVGNFPHMGSVPHHSLAALARVHGPLMHLRLGFVDVIVAASASVAEQFLKIHDSSFSSRPPNAGAKYIAYNYQDMVFAPYGPRWRLLRKLTSVHLFSGKAMDEFRHLRQEEAARLTCNLASSSDTKKAVNLGQLLNVCTTHALARVMIGRRVFDDGNGGCDLRADEFKAMVVELMVLAGVFNIGDFIPSLEWLDLQGVQAKMMKLHKRFDAFLSSIIKEHNVSSKSDEKHKNLLSILMSPKDVKDDDGNHILTDTEIKALLLNLFAAKIDTSSITTEWIIAKLIRNPRILVQVQQELDIVVDKDRNVKEEDLVQLPYLETMIKEIFRLHPSIPLSLSRVTFESCEIFGYHIPKCATFLMNVWVIARDPKEWTDPLEFKSKKFIPSNEKVNVNDKGNNFEVIPFSVWRRICVGLSLGFRMVQLLTKTLTHSFDWELDGWMKHMG